MIVILNFEIDAITDNHMVTVGKNFFHCLIADASVASSDHYGLAFAIRQVWKTNRFLQWKLRFEFLMGYCDEAYVLWGTLCLSQTCSSAKMYPAYRFIRTWRCKYFMKCDTDIVLV